MNIDKKTIKYVNNNINRELYEKYINYTNIISKCLKCDRSIFYYDSGYRINKNGELYFKGKSPLTKKTINDKDYHLCVCEECLTKEYPEYQTLNKSRVFNRICDITNYAFNIPKEEGEEWKKKNYSITLENLMEKHGEKNGKKKWKEYVNKQALTNTFEYKKEKYGWTKDEFDVYNKSRSITLKNMIKKHGEKNGTEVYENYIKRQSYTCSKEYFIEEYGEIQGKLKFDNFVEKKTNFLGYSKISQDFFDVLDKYYKEYTTFYATKNEEYEIINKNDYYYMLDYYIKELNICVEYNGDMWHANPNMFEAHDNPIPYKKDLYADEIWERDNNRIKKLKELGIKTFIVWDSEVKDRGMNFIIKKLVENIKNYIKL